MQSPPMPGLVADLVAEQEVLDRLVNSLSLDRWDAPSPAEGWTLRDSVAHLAEFDQVAAFALAERRLPPPGGGRTGVLTPAQLRARTLATTALLEEWRDARRRLAAAAAGIDPRERLPWFGPPMSARSFVTARLMEAWSHGLDIHDAAGAEPVDSDRLRHIAQMGYLTRDFAFRTHGLEPPPAPLFVRLTAPSGDVWMFGPEDAVNRISGPAGDFCRVVTQRIHTDDTRLTAEGEDAATFLRVAQAFAGPPGSGRPPRGAG